MIILLEMNLHNFFIDFLSLIYPNLCLGCDYPLPKGSKYICPKCHYNLPKTNTYKLQDHIFKDKFNGVVPIEHVLVYTYFIKNGIMQHVLHDLKYNDNQEIGLMMGRWFGHDLLLGGYSASFDMIIPVPLHRERLKKRGYNQAAAFGSGLAEVLKIDQRQDILRRNKHIESQTRKSKVRRIQNVEGIFEVESAHELIGKRVLLVDDVLTTGSTLIACAEPLVSAGVQSISIAVLAGVK